MTFLTIILVTIALWLIFSPYIKPWLRRRAERKLQDYLRAQMGMPTEKEQRRARREAEKQEKRTSGKLHAPAEIIPREYAVDVEYTEIRQFSQTTIASDSDSGRSFVTECQVSDVEYTEIKSK